MPDTPISISQDSLVEPPKPAPRRVLLKWSLIATGLLFAFLLWQCGSGFVEGGRTSDLGVAAFHQKMNAGKFDEIYDQADSAFQQSDKKEEMLKFFTAIHNKLGDAGNASRGMINVNVNTSGTFVTVTYTTTYEKGTPQRLSSGVKVFRVI